MKLAKRSSSLAVSSSPPAWEAWIETLDIHPYADTQNRRLPHGRRGLKLLVRPAILARVRSPPAWEAWIETRSCDLNRSWKKSPPAWEAWIETEGSNPCAEPGVSPPAWEAWIETAEEYWVDQAKGVASRMGGVD